jgi:hypothetical protein
MATTPQSRTKGNPAAKRMSNAHRKAYRAILWAQQERKKDEREVAQLISSQRNEERGYTEWDVAKRNRYEKRH